MGWLFDKALDFAGKINDRATFGSPRMQSDVKENFIEKAILRQAEKIGNVKQGVPVEEIFDFKHRNGRNRSNEINTITSTSPAFGAPIYCELIGGGAEHSGIYVGGKSIVNLQGTGKITMVSPAKFTSHPTTIVKAIWFPIDKASGMHIGFNDAGNAANKMVHEGIERNYNLFLDNCHQFTSGCLTGNFENADNDLWMLKHTINEYYSGEVAWIKWNWRY